MTKKYYIELAEYNIWANNLIHSWCEALTDEQWSMPIENSFKGINNTALHILAAEFIWHERLTHVEKTTWLAYTIEPQKEDVLARWKQASANLLHFVQNITEEDLFTPLMFKRINGEEQSLLLYQVFSHVFNHSTYHRGQLITMMRQAGFTGVSSTDLLTFYRNK
jgi:uncharacterized damage-inducible protein DinB